MDDEKFQRIIDNLEELAELAAGTRRALVKAVGDELAADLHAAWVALEASTDPSDVELMNQIRERTRARADGPQAG